MTELENNAFKQVEGEYFTLKRRKAELEKTRDFCLAKIEVIEQTMGELEDILTRNKWGFDASHIYEHFKIKEKVSEKVE